MEKGLFTGPFSCLWSWFGPYIRPCSAVAPRLSETPSPSVFFVIEGSQNDA